MFAFAVFGTNYNAFFHLFSSIFSQKWSFKNFPYHKKEVFFHMNTPMQLKIRGHTK